MTIKRLWQQVLSVFAVSFALMFTGVSQASWEEAGSVIDTATADMLELMANETLLQEENQDQLIAEIDAVIASAVDFDVISKRVMGKYYRKASKDQRAYFSDVFKTTLLKTYAKALVGFKIEKYEMVPPKKKSPDNKKQVVSVNVFAADGAKYTLVYYMVKTDDGWKLVNALLDGINLRVTFKNQFADIVQKNRGDVKAAIESWKESIDPDKSEA